MSVGHVAYGKEKNGKYFVQSCCEQLDCGTECDCETHGTNLDYDKAIKLANEIAEGLEVEVHQWEKGL